MSKVTTSKNISEKCLPFKEAMKFLSTIEELNYGGCAIAAIYLYDTLVKEGYNPKIIYCYYEDSSSFNTNQQYLSGNTKTLCGCSHAVISVNGEYYDSDGMCNYVIDQYDLFHEMTRETVIASIRRGTNWNYYFNRPTNLPLIRNYFGYGILRGKNNLVSN